ncbi:EI24 domain-containing protein [Cryobacterium sp. PAMC25264]|uniref:EI24 domain-containing protein n=1 Tax=Cryobacterium sp. PAMC25264 TaxID=2861288 RepID=UPI001C6305DF|nr:EI24 domain-containing protein [Cryobacterium sp. PAMC25264]QYF75090.1 EI24 domain-containing protein [Cryobacterium sp. PAMC25264]
MPPESMPEPAARPAAGGPDATPPAGSLAGSPATPAAPAAPTRRGLLGDLLTGAGFLGRGFGLWITSPRLMLLGALPAFLVGIVYLAGIVVLLVNLDTIVIWATPFADRWAEPLILTTRVAAALVFVVVAALVAVYTFTAVTLVVGDPFYERIWTEVESRLGNPPAAVQRGFWRSLGRAVGDALRLLLPAVGVGLLLLAGGFVPLVGPVLVAALGAVLGGWLLSIELTGLAFDARGYTLRDRRRALRSRRPVAIGFGAAAYLLFLIPFVAVVAMPAAVAGAAMFSRDTLGIAPARQ